MQVSESGSGETSSSSKKTVRRKIDFSFLVVS